MFFLPYFCCLGFEDGHIPTLGLLQQGCQLLTYNASVVDVSRIEIMAWVHVLVLGSPRPMNVSYACDICICV